jgi:hypothetical protein
MQRAVLSAGEKIHIIHRRHLEKEPHRHFVGLVEAYEGGIARVTGYIFTVDPVRFEFIRRPDPRTRIVSLLSGDILVNIIPLAVDLDKVIYQQEAKAVRVTDGSNWQHGDDLLSLESEDVFGLLMRNGHRLACAWR